MLQVVAVLDLSDSYGTVGVPKQLVIKKDPSSILDYVNETGLRLPIGRPFAYCYLFIIKS
ncbi:hypothetical protein ACS0TY_029958 [Phlomoides rotata]